MPRKGPRIDPDPERSSQNPGSICDLTHLLRTTDVPRVDPHAVRACIESLEGESVIEVDVGNDGDWRVAHDDFECFNIVVTWDGAAHEVRSGLGNPTDLSHRLVKVRRLRLGHRLDCDGGSATDEYAAYVDLSLRCHFNEVYEARPDIAQPDRESDPRARIPQA